MSTALLCDGWNQCADGSDELESNCIGLSNNNRRQTLDTSTIDTGKNTYLIILLIFALSGGTFIVAFYYCRRRFNGNEELPDILHDSAGDPLSPKTYRMAKPMLAQKNSRKNLKLDTTIRMSTLNASSISSSYDRSHITGFSYCKLKIIFITRENFFLFIVNFFFFF